MLDDSAIFTSDWLYPAFSGVTAHSGDLQPQAFLSAEFRGGHQENGLDSLTVGQAALQLTRDDLTWGPASQPVTLTYAFRPRGPIDMPGDSGGFSLFNAPQIAQTKLALQAWSDVAQINFVQLNPGGFSPNATILFGNYEHGEDDAAAFAYLPGDAGPLSSDGDVWVNSSEVYNHNPFTFTYGGLVLVHEIGHALGLDHPGNYGTGSDVDPNYLGHAGYAEDSLQYTVMSYFSEFNTGGDFRELYPAAPMLDDIAAIQLLYGANMTTRTGDTVYGFNSTALRPWFDATGAKQVVFAAWDAGGSDTFDFSGYLDNAVIDLRQGHFSSVGGLTGNVAVAIGTDIERALSGGGDDQLLGNALANWLRGGAGADQISGFAGIDDMQGNAGTDTLWGGDGADWVVGGQDGDQLNGEAGDDLIYGNLGSDTALGGDGNDTITAGQQDDLVRGENGDDWLGGDRGNDTLFGGAGADSFRFFVGAGVDKVMDFNLAEGDRVLITGSGAYTVSQMGSDTVVDFGGGDQVVLAGVTASNLSGSWIVAG
ncbi:MAG: M10 family metallopeptidase C-terminal domain-containing protein [Phenylobacterium sp.]